MILVIAILYTALKQKYMMRGLLNISDYYSNNNSKLKLGFWKQNLPGLQVDTTFQYLKISVEQRN